MKFDIALAKGSAEAASPLIGLCYNRAHQLEGRFVTEAYELDGCTAILKVRGDSSVVIISCGDSGVVIHPRTGVVELLSYTEYLNQLGLNIPVTRKTIWGVKGGWLNGTTNYDGANIYPIVDEDNASFGLGLEDEEAEEKVVIGEFLQDEGNYGNLYWWNGNVEEPDFLSWKGTPTRHFRVPNNIEIPGISTQETTIPSSGGEDTPVFTTFSHYVYSGGVVLETAPAYNWPNAGPPLAYVLGAARDSEDVIFIVTQSDRFNVPLYIAAFSDGTIVQNDTGQGVDPPSGVDRIFYKNYANKGGIYTQLWKQGTQFQGWDLIWEEETGRQGLPWFADIECSYFVNPLGEQLSIDGIKTVLGIDGSGYIKLSASTINNVVSVCLNGNFEAVYTNDALFEPEGFAKVNLEFNTNTFKTYKETNPIVYTGTFPILYDPDYPPAAPQPLTWDPASDQFVELGKAFSYGVNGGQGTITYEFNGFTVDSNNIVTSTGCGMGSVRAIDSCGDSVEVPIRLPIGFWELVSSTFSTCTDGGNCGYNLFDCNSARNGIGGCGPFGGPCFSEIINGGSRTVTAWGDVPPEFRNYYNFLCDVQVSKTPALGAPIESCCCTNSENCFATEHHTYTWVCP